MLGINKSIFKDMVEAMAIMFCLPNLALRKTAIVDKKPYPIKKYTCASYAS